MRFREVCIITCCGICAFLLVWSRQIVASSSSDGYKAVIKAAQDKVSGFTNIQVFPSRKEVLRTEKTPEGNNVSEQETTEQETTKQETTKQEATKQETTKQEATKQETTKQETTKQETTKQETTKQDPCVEDPLASGCIEFAAFPKTALTVEQLRFCDQKQNPLLPKGYNEFNCTKDPTCRECRSPSKMKQMRSVLGSFRAAKRFKRRETFFKERFSYIDENGVRQKRQVVVAGLNLGQTHLFLNWACSANKLGLNATEFVYMIPTDKETRDILVKHGFATEPLDWLEESGVKISKKYAGANAGPHAMINSLIAAGAESLVLHDYPAFLMDVDMIWLKNPLPFLKRASARRDIIGSYAPRLDAYGSVNTGAVYFIPTQRTKIFLSTFVNLSELKRTSDQVTFNSLIRYYLFRQLSVTVLPHSVFNTNWSKRKLKKQLAEANAPQPYILHIVGTHKGKRLQLAKKWFLDRQCAYFDKDTMLYAIKNSVDSDMDFKAIDM